MEEVDTAKIKVLERITVTGVLDNSIDTVNVVLYNNEYYCIDDPCLLQGKDRVKVRVIAEVQSEEELWKEYVSNNVRNVLNPYAILLLHIEGKPVLSGLPEKWRNIVKRNSSLDRIVITKLNEQLIHFKNVVYVDFAILDVINNLLQEAKKNGVTNEKVLELLLMYIDTWVAGLTITEEDEEEDEVVTRYPDPLAITANISYLIHEEVKKKKVEKKGKEEVEEKEVRKGVKDVKIVISDSIDKEEGAEGVEEEKDSKSKMPTTVTTTIPAIAAVTTGTTGTRTDTGTGINPTEVGTDKDRYREEAITDTTVFVKRKVSFVLAYPENLSPLIDKLINRIFNYIQKLLARYGITIEV